jgi:hypothetical protein
MENTSYGEYFDNEESVKEAIVKSCNHIKRQPVVTENKPKQL